MIFLVGTAMVVVKICDYKRIASFLSVGSYKFTKSQQRKESSFQSRQANKKQVEPGL